MGTNDCIFVRNKLKNVDEIVSKMFKSYVVLIDDLEKLFPNCQLALFQWLIDLRSLEDSVSKSNILIQLKFRRNLIEKSPNTAKIKIFVISSKLIYSFSLDFLIFPKNFIYSSFF